MLVLVLPPVSSRVSGLPVASPCLWGKLQNLSFCHVANCEKCRKSRTKCCFFASTCLVSSRWFSCGVAVSMGVAGKLVLFECFQAGCHVVLRGRRGFPHSTLHTLHSSLYTPHSTLYTPHSTLSTPDSTLYTLRSTLHTPHFTLLTPHSTLYTPHSTLCTPHSTPHTLHATLHTLHSTLQSVFTDHTLAHPLNCRGGVVARLSA